MGTRGGRRLSKAQADLALRFLFAREKPWTGPVERRDPASYRRPSEVMICKCANCKHWTPKRLATCTICQALLVPFTLL